MALQPKGPEQAAQSVLRASVGVLLDNLSFSSTSGDAVDLLTELAARFMHEAVRRGKGYAEHAGRTRLIHPDLEHAFTRMHFSVAELHDYVHQNGAVPSLKPVPSIPVACKPSRSIFAPAPSERELEVRPAHIPAHFPATHPEWTNENADYLTMFKSGATEKKPIADFPDFFACSATSLGLFQNKVRDPPEIKETANVVDHVSLTGITSSANVAAQRQEEAEAVKPVKIPKKKGRPRKILEFAPPEKSSDNPPLIVAPPPPKLQPNSLTEGTSSETSSPLPPKLELAIALKEKSNKLAKEREKARAAAVSTPPVLENCIKSMEDGESSNQSTSSQPNSTVSSVSKQPALSQTPSLLTPLKRKYTKKHERFAKLKDKPKMKNSGVKLPGMSKSFLEAQKKQLQLFEQQKLRKEAQEAAAQAAAEVQRRQAEMQKATLDATITSMLLQSVQPGAVPSATFDGANQQAAAVALLMQNLIVNAHKKDTQISQLALLNTLTHAAAANAAMAVAANSASTSSAPQATTSKQSPSSQLQPSISTSNSQSKPSQSQPKLKLVFSKSNSNLAETSVRSVKPSAKDERPVSRENRGKGVEDGGETMPSLMPQVESVETQRIEEETKAEKRSSAIASTSVFGAQQVGDDSDSDTVPFIGGTALSPSAAVKSPTGLLTTFPADLNEKPENKTPEKSHRRNNEEGTPLMTLNSHGKEDKERSKEKKRKRKKDKKKDSKDSADRGKDRDRDHHRSHKKKKKHKRERDERERGEKRDRDREREREREKAHSKERRKEEKHHREREEKQQHDSQPGTSQSIVLQISNRNSDLTSKDISREKPAAKSTNSNYSPPEKMPRLEPIHADESPKEQKIGSLKIKFGGMMKPDVATTSEKSEKKDERVVPPLSLKLTGLTTTSSGLGAATTHSAEKLREKPKSETVPEKRSSIVEVKKEASPQPIPMPALVSRKKPGKVGRPPGSTKKEAKKIRKEFENDILNYVDGAELKRTSSSCDQDEKSSGEEAEEEKEQIWICPACSIAYTEGANMVCCDTCDDWFHWHCVGLIVEPPENIPWFCPKCAKSKKSIKRPVSGLKTERKRSQAI